MSGGRLEPPGKLQRTTSTSMARLINTGDEWYYRVRNTACKSSSSYFEPFTNPWTQTNLPHTCTLENLWINYSCAQQWDFTSHVSTHSSRRMLERRKKKRKFIEFIKWPKDNLCCRKHIEPRWSTDKNVMCKLISSPPLQEGQKVPQQVHFRKENIQQQIEKNHED